MIAALARIFGRRAPSRTRARARGYTMLEVMVSMGILTIGAAGVIGMQKAAIQGNVDARRMDTANAIARIWIERLRSNAMLWTLPAARNPNDNRNANSLLLVDANVDGLWHVRDEFLGTAPFWSQGFDTLGADVLTNELGDDKNRYAHFCTNVRLTWLVQGTMMRADVRVFWPRGVGAAPDEKFCAQEPPVNLETMTDKYHFVYAMTAIRRNAIQ